MKNKIATILVALVTVFLLSQCSSPMLAQKPLPPGQAKKVAGQQSAKEFAPGQQKKGSTTTPPGQAKKKKK